MNPYQVVNDFEKALSAYTGAPYVVCVNSCSSALLLAFSFYKPTTLIFPSKTYCSAPMAAIHAGHKVEFRPFSWIGEYQLAPIPVWDSARRFTSGMYRAKQYQCVSFQTSKILGIEQGGAILHDNKIADEWFRRARFDGRLSALEKVPQQLGFHCYMNPSTASLGIQRLSCLPKDNPDQVVEFPDLSKLDIWN